VQVQYAKRSYPTGTGTGTGTVTTGTGKITKGSNLFFGIRGIRKNQKSGKSVRRSLLIQSSPKLLQ
jgi:hypothetical protein